ncbi:MAG: cytochrome-c oxidase [Rhodobacterales bacterium 34-62-10]|nr:MAG: cytochrome-c oxidase [Rhodobacterales bacterium 34-62-10]
MKNILLLIALVAGLPAYADHPGDRLDELMAQKEPAFAAVDLNELPALDLLSPDGEPLDLESLSDQVVVLSFVSSNCGLPCADQQALLEKVRGGVNASPMLDMVTFLVVTDASDPVPGPIAENVVVARAEKPMEDLVERYRAIAPDHPEAPLVHVIARGNRHAGIFAGSAFRHINMILYVNGLTNAH